MNCYCMQYIIIFFRLLSTSMYMLFQFWPTQVPSLSFCYVVLFFQHFLTFWNKNIFLYEPWNQLFLQRDLGVLLKVAPYSSDQSYFPKW